MGFTTKMPRSIRIGAVLIPAEYAKLCIATLNYKPVDGVARDRAANFAPKFLKRSHRYPNSESYPPLPWLENN
jgi:hypothetical protein